MPETVSKGLEVPSTGSLPGTWGDDAVNPNMVAIDGILGGFAAVALTNANVSLTVPSGYVATPGAGPTQSQNAMITFTGTLTGNCTITFPLPGYYIVENLCVVGAFYVRLGSSSPGNYVCAPPGEAVHVFNDGTNMRYVNLGRVGQYLDLGASAVPAWISNCTVPPYLLCDGSTFNASTYPNLNALLGGNTLPDARGRSRFSLDGGTSRITNAVSGVDGATLLAAGGSQAMQQHTHTFTGTALPAHSHSYTMPQSNNPVTLGGGQPNGGTVSSYTSAVSAGTPAGTNSTEGAGSSQNMPPAYIGGITLIRAG